MLRVDTTFTYTIELPRSETLLWVWGWCAQDDATLADNLDKMNLAFTLNGQEVAVEQFLPLDYPTEDGQSCRAYILGLTKWPSGEHRLTTLLTFTDALNDGVYDFKAGFQKFEYFVTVK
jgi:hypothetical protein